MAEFDWKSLVGTVAPTLATALGGPFAGMAVKAMSAALLGNEDATHGDLAAALAGATPDTMLKLKEAENSFALRMKELDVDVYKIDASDRDSARTMQSVTKSMIVPVLATITVGGFFAVIGFVLTGTVPKDSTIVGMVIGAVGSKTEQIYNFYFGSSAGSKDKTAHLAKR